MKIAAFIILVKPIEEKLFRKKESFKNLKLINNRIKKMSFKKILQFISKELKIYEHKKKKKKKNFKTELDDGFFKNLELMNSVIINTKKT